MSKKLNLNSSPCQLQYLVPSIEGQFLQSVFKTILKSFSHGSIDLTVSYSALGATLPVSFSCCFLLPRTCDQWWHTFLRLLKQKDNSDSPQRQWASSFESIVALSTG